MKMRRIPLGAFVIATMFLTALCGGALAQQSAIKDLLIGTLALLMVTSEAADGTKTEPFGSNPKGMMMFSREGHFSLFQSRAEIPKIAANDRAKA
jgi:hypothetical protein